MNKPIVAISGKNGQLGSELQMLINNYPAFYFLFAAKEELNLADKNSIEIFFQKNNPSFFINCAAYTAVDKAETEKEIAYTINAEAVGTIAKLCKQYQTKLIHISTDYVFNGNANEPYEPDDKTDPVNYYGYSKCEGEKLAIENYPETIIIRTSWVYSEFGNNFVKTMLRLMKDRTEINVVNDQLGSPTYAKDLAEVILEIIKQDAKYPGICHFSNGGEINWQRFAEEIRNEIHSACKVNGIPTTQYLTPAKRPHYSVMNKDKIVNVYGITIKDWQESLKECLKKLAVV
jgi:dTDP-4-dehydrorhamnose reductase